MLIPFTIANGASLSAAIDRKGLDPLGFVMPAAFTGTSLTFQTSEDGSSYGDLFDGDDTELVVKVAVGRRVRLTGAQMGLLMATPYSRFVPGPPVLHRFKRRTALCK